MLNMLLGAIFALLALRGYWRGFVREAMDLAGALAGLLLAFRFSYPTGDALSSVIGASPWAARLVSGGLIFVAIGVVASLIAGRLQSVVNLPGLRLSNRLAGAGLAVLWGGVIATLILSIGLLVPIQAVEESIEGSSVASVLVDSDGPTQKLLALLSGDRALEMMLNLRGLIGAERVTVAGDASYKLPPVPLTTTSRDDESAIELFERVNRDRAEAGLPTLAWSSELARVGALHAQDMYASGLLAHHSPATGSLADRIQAANVDASVVGENFALAADPADVQRGLMASPSHRENLLHTEFDTIGIGAVSGPYGLMVVQVFSD